MAAAVGTAAAAALAGCGGDESGGGKAGAPSGTLSLLCWQGYDDPKAAKPVTDAGVKLDPQYISNNDEIVTKLVSGGVGSYDVTTPYHGYIGALVEAGVLAPIDTTRLTSYKDYFPQFQKPDWATLDGQTYAAPLVWGDTPMVYRTDLVPELPESWLDLRDAKYKGKIVLWDDGYGHILLFSKVLFGDEAPNELTRGQLDEVMAVLREIKKNAVTIAPSHGDAADILARGDGAIQTEGWAFVAQQVRAKGKPADVYLPKEGAFAWADSYCLVKDAPNEDAAYAFMDAMTSRTGDAVIAEATSSGAVNSKAVQNLPAEQKKLYPYDDLDNYFSKLGFYSIPPLESEGDIMSLQDWNQAWEEFKAG
jgi:putative spermidine/putrescine transport system substrate-binding protein/spermidine/putrescine transport system substrate-binding protein